MEPTTDFSSYSDAELAEFARRLKGAQFSGNYGALRAEMRRRQLIHLDSQDDAEPKTRKAASYAAAPGWWLGGNLLGALLGGGIFAFFNPASGPNYGEGIGWGFALMGYAALGALVCGIGAAFWGVFRVGGP